MTSTTTKGQGSSQQTASSRVTRLMKPQSYPMTGMSTMHPKIYRPQRSGSAVEYSIWFWHRLRRETILHGLIFLWNDMFCLNLCRIWPNSLWNWAIHFDMGASPNHINKSVLPQLWSDVVKPTVYRNLQAEIKQAEKTNGAIQIL